MIYGKWFAPGSVVDETAALRDEVFVRELGMGVGALHMERDAISHVAVLYDEEKRAAATGRIYFWEDTFCVDLVAVRAPLRGQGYGDLVVRMLLDKALQHFARCVRLFTREEAEAYFARYSFSRVSCCGGIVEMTAAAEELVLGGTCARGK